MSFCGVHFDGGCCQQAGIPRQEIRPSPATGWHGLRVCKVDGPVNYALIMRDSGTTSRRRSTSAGRASIRRVLYMSDLVATRHNPTMQRFYKRLIAKGKPKKVALVAVMRKPLLTRQCHGQEQPQPATIDASLTRP